MVININKINVSQIELFNDLDTHSSDKVLQCFTNHIYDKNTVIFNEKDLINNIYIIIDGAIEISKYDLSGNKNIVALLSSNDLFAESIVLSSNNISPYAIRTLVKSRIISVDYSSFKKLLVNYPVLAINMISIMANKNTLLSNKINCISKNTIRERFYELLRYHYIKSNSTTIVLPFTKTQLADFLCVGRSSLSREISKMINENIFTNEKKTYHLNEQYFNKM